MKQAAGAFPYCRAAVLRLSLRVGAGLAVLTLATSLALAADPEPAASPEKQPGYIVTLGAYGDLEPRFEGARRHGFGYQPIIDIRREGAREWLDLPRDGADFALTETDNFRAGVVINGRWERDVSSLRRGFRHVGSINLSAEAGAFAEWWPVDYVRTRVEVRDAVLGAKGVVGDLSTDLVLRPGPRWIITAGPRLSLADGAFMRSYYSVDAQQSATSGLPVYSTSAGVRSSGVGSMLKYAWSDTVSTMAFIEYQRLAKAAFDSPLIEERGSPNQLTVGLGVSFKFLVGR